MHNFQMLYIVPEAVLVVDPAADQIMFANKSAMHLLKYEGDELYQRRPSSIFRDSLHKLIVFTETVFEFGRAICDDLTIRTKTDLEIDVELTASVISKSPTQVCFCLRDKNKFEKWRMSRDAERAHNYGLLQWQRIHQVFQNFERENQLILSAAGEGIYGIDVNGNATFVNPAAERILGWHAQELIGKNIHTMIHHSYADGSDFCVHDCPIYSAFKDGVIQRVEDDVFWSRSGKPIAVDYTSTPILDSGKLVGAVVIFRDIRDKKIAHKQLQNALTEVENLKQRLEMENAYLQEEIRENYNTHQIVGTSPAVQQVIHQIQLVAPTDATVLVQGESGTGKELIARATHNSSPRSERPLVRVNCAAIPRDLFESEFFGHMKGAFSGALNDRVGRFELANGGSLFLDEVGEIPLELQGKLLRALQDCEYERVGDSKTQHVDVRVIAATNRDLREMVSEGTFREDLFFRLNVFPITSAPLRERRCDIPQLVSHFLKKACQRFNKSELTISIAQMNQLQNYDWPGNIRELENIIERQVILSRGEKLSLKDAPLMKGSHSGKIDVIDLKSLDDSSINQLQKNAIEQALKQSNGKIYGASGAAAMLGVKPTTLSSRIKKHGLKRESFVMTN